MFVSQTVAWSTCGKAGQQTLAMCIYFSSSRWEKGQNNGMYLFIFKSDDGI